MDKTIAILSVLTLVFGLIYCSPKHQEDLGLTRIEQVEKKYFRNLNIPKNVQTELEQDITKILVIIDSINDTRLFWKSNDSIFKEIEQEWDSIKNPQAYSYELWKDYDIRSTFLLYVGHISDTESRKVSDIFIIEIEHQNLTGTCRMFFDSNKPEKLRKLIYTERN